ncbi:mannose-1-phosphate guanyltransferase [Actinoplanes sp. NBRC 14428]|uniref:mannose-1-phosphate guanylyltransferase n=1 Tax=Pseudosporangium ferrugineum TaxID=439699 RepID=A0A2T0S3I4_9ACTN|nr:sugar phosphate nucleotidyltransferase [Pseudosporangium ferrugineum]PRY27981.1 mannose-6-phosphate isomerase type 2 [Pseudosporangium ferrugineum]BCJ52123.1 mannose-1-phosphate guanyltransferase [Actinoplanes sp. NBRC 14428]
MSENRGGLYAVIPAGGSGTRLWPLSRAGHPKFLHPLTGTDASLLQATVSRLLPLADPAQVFVVTGVAHAAAVSRQLAAVPEENILVEPSPRDSCAAIALAAAVIARHDPEAVMGAFAADHLIADGERFIGVIEEAMAGARKGLLMTLGITPTRPETGYGYVQCGGPIGQGSALAVEEFKEKPSYEVAEGYVKSGNYLWNAGMFVWRVDVFLSELARQQPQLHAGISRIAQAWDSSAREEVLGEVWPLLPRISVDYAVMEGAAAVGRVGTVPGDFGWNDVGDFHTLGEVLASDSAGNVVVGKDAMATPGVILRDSENLVVVPNSGRLVAVLGVRDLIVVDTPDAVLVCPRDRAQEVKSIVDELKEKGENSYI